MRWVFVDTDTFAGCVMLARILGVITGTQKNEKGGRVNNDILLAAHVDAITWKNVRSISGVSPALLDEIEFFFTSYRNFQGKEFKVGARHGIAAANRLVRAGINRDRLVSTGVENLS